MMLGLSVDVLPHRLDSGQADGECSITLLPCKRFQLGKIVVDPSGQNRFDRTDEFGHRDIASQLHEQMNVIFDAADPHQGTFAIPGQPAEIWVKAFGQVAREKSLPALGAENDMRVKSRKRLRHRDSPERSFGAMEFAP